MLVCPEREWPDAEVSSQVTEAAFALCACFVRSCRSVPTPLTQFKAMSATRLDPISNQPRTLYDRTCWSEKHCLLVFALVKPCPFAPRTCRCRPVGYLAFNCAVGLGTLIDRLKAKTNVYVRLKLKPLLSQVQPLRCSRFSQPAMVKGVEQFSIDNDPNGTKPWIKAAALRSTEPGHHYTADRSFKWSAARLVHCNCRLT
ncbi:hypothetical protein T4A_212 [Trichinella pseudospiralis]|uniref:Uncharacterized protein n=1 Tax=Trichinella pseudospiralis TaxID=6337 RepID=A0A0V1EBU0_TRIPS|nr:hypothetical protein T4E_3526 [Trichinella pseudospiralis]KRY71247.1 hypothetical protein T4A_212 [Trichinella pseudospiralis]